MPHVYEILSDNTKIEFIERVTHKIIPNGQKGLKKVKLDDDNLKFKYVESLTKFGYEVVFSETEFKRLLNQKMFKKVC